MNAAAHSLTPGAEFCTVRGTTIHGFTHELTPLSGDNRGPRTWRVIPQGRNEAMDAASEEAYVFSEASRGSFVTDGPNGLPC